MSTREPNALNTDINCQILIELNTNLRVLTETQKEIVSLLRQQNKYEVDTHTSKSLHKALNKISERVAILETHRLTTTAANKARSHLVDKIAKYGPLLVAFLFALITVGVVLTLKELILGREI